MNEIEKNNIFHRITGIIETAKTNVVRSINHEMIFSYWLIGKEIVEEEQSGLDKAVYGKKLIKNLSDKLTKKYGKGYSATNLEYFRKFYLIYKSRNSISHSPSEEFINLPNNRTIEIPHSVGEVLNNGGNLLENQPFNKKLSWTHYRTIMRVDSDYARAFYEIEAGKNNWSTRELERQIASLLFERLAKGKNIEQLYNLSLNGQEISTPEDLIKDPYLFEFLNIPESSKLIESDLEQQLITHLQQFLLELGKGFAFIGRQQRLTLDGDHFYVDLIFYHVQLKCYVLIDLKTKKLSHADLGQMQLYVNYYDNEIKQEDDSLTIGLILCTDKNDTVVKYLLGEENKQIFASKYKLYLPDEKELELELKHEIKLLSNKYTSKTDKD